MSVTGPQGTEDPLEELREELDRIDAQFLDIVRKRINCCVRIAHHKKEHGLPMMQPHRIGIVQRRAAEYGQKHDIDQDFLRRLYDVIIDETCRVEDLVIAKPAAS
jgi:chorismate mutase-like protein